MTAPLVMLFLTHYSSFLQDGNIVETSLFEFLSDEDFPLNGNKRPPTWRQSVLALRDEMVTHPGILTAVTFFNVETTIIDWLGVSSP